MSRLAARLRVVVLVAALVLLPGCHLDVEVGVVVEEDGAGVVEVVVALDEAAAARVPELAAQLEVDDLVATGWTVDGPLEEDGRTEVRASKPFTSLEGAAAVLDEVSGADGPFGGLTLRREPSLLRDEWHLDGTVDLTGGLAAFSDEALRARLDGTDVGLTEEEVATTAGRPVAEAVTFSVTADLPGTVRSDGGTVADGGAAVWHPVLGEAVVIDATGTRLNVATVVLLVVALAAVVAFVLLVLFRTRRRRALHGRRRSEVGTVGR